MKLSLLCNTAGCHERKSLDASRLERCDPEREWEWTCHNDHTSVLPLDTLLQIIDEQHDDAEVYVGLVDSATDDMHLDCDRMYVKSRCEHCSHAMRGVVEHYMLDDDDAIVCLCEECGSHKTLNQPRLMLLMEEKRNRLREAKASRKKSSAPCAKAVSFPAEIPSVSSPPPRQRGRESERRAGKAVMRAASAPRPASVIGDVSVVSVKDVQRAAYELVTEDLDPELPKSEKGLLNCIRHAWDSPLSKASVEHAKRGKPNPFHDGQPLAHLRKQPEMIMEWITCIKYLQAVRAAAPKRAGARSHKK